MKAQQRWIALAAVTLLLGTSCAYVARSSVANGGGDPLLGSSDPVLSGDGRFVAFTSAAGNLVAGDTNGVTDVFVRDHQTGVTELISVDSGGGPANGFSDTPDMSPDGRFVVFTSFASDLVAGDTNGVPDVFIRDRTTGVTERISVDSAEVPGVAGALEASVSDNGNRVAFSTFDAFDPIDTNGDFDIYIRDRFLGITLLMSSTADNSAAAGGSFGPALSGDGSAVVFASSSDDVVAGDTNGLTDVFWRTTALLIKLRVSTPNVGGDSNGTSGGPAISELGDIVVYDSSATNLVAGDTNGETDVFRWDLNEIINSNQNLLVSQQSNGTLGNGRSFNANVDATGDDIVYVSDATNLQEPGASPVDTNGDRDAFHWTAGANVLASQTLGAQPTNDRTFSASISNDGSAIAYATDADNLGFTDGNGATDVVVRPTFVPTISGVAGNWTVGSTSTLVFSGTFGPNPNVFVTGNNVTSTVVAASSLTSVTVDITTSGAAASGDRTIWISEPAPQLGINAPLGSADNIDVFLGAPPP